MLEMYKIKVDMINKRIEEAREKWNTVQTESMSTKQQSYGQRSFRLTLEQELVIKENLSETYDTYYISLNVFTLKLYSIIKIQLLFLGDLQY